jgi:hypothetical protein
MTTATPSRDDARDDPITRSQRNCQSCSAAFAPTGRQAYCTPACRQRAYRQRSIATDTQTETPARPTRSRRPVTVYQCLDCDELLLGQQWCPDCQRPCRRVGRGGTCPHCDEPVTIDQLLDATP